MKTQNKKLKAFNNTPNPQKLSPHNTSSHYVNILKQSNKFQSSKAITPRSETFNSPKQFCNKIPIAQTPGALGIGSSKVLFFKTKFLNLTACEPSPKDSNSSHSGKDHIPNLNLADRALKTEGHQSSQSDLFNIKGQKIITPRNFSVQKDEKSPLSAKTNTLVRNNSAYKFSVSSPKITNAHSGKTLSISSIDNINKGSVTKNKSLEYLGSDRLQRYNTVGVINDSIDQVGESRGLSIQQGPLKEDERCINHPHKKAKYIQMISESECDPSQRFCSKCAILIAAQGLKVKEMLASDEDIRKAEVEDFLVKLTSYRKKMDDLMTSLNRKRDDLATFYTKQFEKADLIVMGLQKFIQEEKIKALESLTIIKEQTFTDFGEMERKILTNSSEINTIHLDIDQNIEKIIKNIDIAPFKAIMGKYQEKLVSLDRLIDQVNFQQINVAKLSGYSVKAYEKLKPMINSFFTTVKMSTSLIKKNEKNDELGPKMSEDQHQALSKSSLYISFENKEMFENVMNSSIENPRRCSDICSYTYRNETGSNVSTANNTLKASKPMNLIGNYDTLKIEETKFVRKTDIDLEGIMTLKTMTTPRPEKKLQKFISLTDNTKSTTNNPNTSPDEIFKTEGDILIQDNFNPNKVNPLESNASLEGVAETGLSSKIFENFGASSSKSTKKYKNILEKINANQSVKNVYYNNMLKPSQMASPRYAQYEDDHNFEASPSSSTNKANESSKVDVILSPDVVEKVLEGDANANEINPLSSNGGLNVFGPLGNEIKTENNPQKELKNYGNFFHFIENKINDEKQNNTSTNSYQKTLFCSPNFKDNIQPQEELI